MGLAKKDHVRHLLTRIAPLWVQQHERAPDEADCDRLYQRLEPLIAEAAATQSALIPGAKMIAEGLRVAGLKIGSTTGYTRGMMEPVLARTAAEGYRPDAIVCAGETAAGRPAPLMLYRIAAELGVWPLSSVVKVDDAPSGIAEGLNAGAWTIGVAASGNGVGLSVDEFTALPPDDQAARITTSRQALQDAGAHYVVDSVANIMPILHHIAARLRAGARP
jgi:phosphonoacetaldehyde hydrolase